mmetsp:Transcript_23303/g.56123  ORF Transcript_23303/g.56123 Transcript_23303/m.56123 type:complete len:146 (-) Transcript_23303:1176-1613(-)
MESKLGRSPTAFNWKEAFRLDRSFLPMSMPALLDGATTRVVAGRVKFRPQEFTRQSKKRIYSVRAYSLTMDDSAHSKLVTTQAATCRFDQTQSTHTTSDFPLALTDLLGKPSCNKSKAHFSVIASHQWDCKLLSEESILNQVLWS